LDPTGLPIIEVADIQEQLTIAEVRKLLTGREIYSEIFLSEGIVFRKLPSISSGRVILENK
jgi:hypothetical protein